MLLLICLGLLFYEIMTWIFFCKDTAFQLLWEQKKKQHEKMRERTRTQLGSWRDCESQARGRKRSRNKLHGRNRGGIWSLYSKCSSVTKVIDPTLCGAFHFPGARNRAWAERACVCVLAHMCVIVCLRCPCDPSLDSHARTGAHTQPDSLCWWERVSARRYRPFGAGSSKHVHSTLKTLKVCCEGAHA